MQQFGLAAPVTCPACGVGAVAGTCTLTRGEVVTLSCSTCGLRVRNGVVLQRGVDVDPDEIRGLAELRDPSENPRMWYIAPEARPLLLIPTDAVTVSMTDPEWPTISSVTVRFARRRTEARER